jgi:hypothetical protein
MPPPPMRAPWVSAGALATGFSASSSGGLGSSPRALPCVPSTNSSGARSVSPATGSHFPQLARPLPGGAAITGDTHDTMSPTAAPWAVGAPPPGPPPLAFPSRGAAAGGGAGAAPRRPPGAAAGRPVAALVEAAPSMPRAPAPGELPAAFEAPAKRIASEEDLRRFLEGPAAKDFVAFILSLNLAVTGERAAGHGEPRQRAPPRAACMAPPPAGSGGAVGSGRHPKGPVASS